MNQIGRTFRTLLLAGALGCGLSAQAAIIYNNSTNDLVQRFNPGLVEVGDEIDFAGTERWVTQFNFQYYGTNHNTGLFSGNVSVRVRFYANDGTPFNGYATPGTQLWDSGWYGISATPRNGIDYTVAGLDFPATGLLVPNTITWSVQFQGLGSGDEAGVDLFSPAVVGGTHTDFWENNAGSWSLKTNALPVNFAAVFVAEPAAVPEPGTTTLLVLGGLGMLTLLRRRV